MAESRLKVVALFVLIFLFGMATGGLSYRLLETGYFRPHSQSYSRDHRGDTVQKFTRELGLNADQIQRLNTILEESEGKFRELNKSVKPQADAIRQESRNKIRALLNEEQKPKFEEMLKKMDEERRKRDQARNK